MSFCTLFWMPWDGVIKCFSLSPQKSGMHSCWSFYDPFFYPRDRIIEDSWMFLNGTRKHGQEIETAGSGWQVFHEHGWFSSGMLVANSGPGHGQFHYHGCEDERDIFFTHINQLNWIPIVRCISTWKWWTRKTECLDICRPHPTAPKQMPTVCRTSAPFRAALSTSRFNNSNTTQQMRVWSRATFT